MSCNLCNENNNDIVIGENKSAIAYICYCPLKDSHVLIIPKRHIEKLSNFKKTEAKDFLELCEEMQDLVKKSIGGNQEPFLFRNYGKCITQSHIHFHVVPSSGCLRDLVSVYDDVKKRVSKDNKEMNRLADILIKNK
jgi:diadenosine tetraphosphate (Ap4A) HIT family hydrolase